MVFIHIKSFFVLVEAPPLLRFFCLMTKKSCFLYLFEDPFEQIKNSNTAFCQVVCVSYLLAVLPRRKIIFFCVQNTKQRNHRREREFKMIFLIGGGKNVFCETLHRAIYYIFHLSGDRTYLHLFFDTPFF